MQKNNSKYVFYFNTVRLDLEQLKVKKKNKTKR